VPETRFRERKRLITDRDPASEPVTAHELETRIACRGKAASQVLDGMSRGLSTAETRNLDPLIVLEDLGLLQDSVATLIKGVCRLLVGYPRAVTFWESSGYTEAFLTAMESQGPTAR
jgi:hypothetical protein